MHVAVILQGGGKPMENGRAPRPVRVSLDPAASYQLGAGGGRAPAPPLRAAGVAHGDCPAGPAGAGALRGGRARAGRESFDLDLFNAGRYAEAVEAQMRSENLTKVLYPSDSTEAGRELLSLIHI